LKKLDVEVYSEGVAMTTTYICQVSDLIVAISIYSSIKKYL